MAYSLPSIRAPLAQEPFCFTEAGAIAAVAQHEFEQFYPQPGWVEHDPTEILTSQMSCAVEALGKVGARPRDISAIGITNQRENSGCVGTRNREADSSSHRMAGQTDSSAVQCFGRERGRDTISNRTGLVIDPYFSATKIKWILDNVSGARARAEKANWPSAPWIAG